MSILCNLRMEVKLLQELTYLSHYSWICFIKVNIQKIRGIDNQTFRYFVNMLWSVQMFWKHLVFDNFVYSHGCLVLYVHRDVPLIWRLYSSLRALYFMLHTWTYKNILYIMVHCICAYSHLHPHHRTNVSQKQQLRKVICGLTTCDEFLYFLCLSIIFENKQFCINSAVCELLGCNTHFKNLY